MAAEDNASDSSGSGSWDDWDPYGTTDALQRNFSWDAGTEAAFEIEFTRDQGETFRGVVRDHSDGTYSLHYRLTLAGDYTASVTFAGKSISGSPFLLSVAPALSAQYDPNPALLDSEGPQETAGVPRRLGVHSIDRFGNPLSQATGPFSLGLSGYPVQRTTQQGQIYFLHTQYLYGK